VSYDAQHSQFLRSCEDAASPAAVAYMDSCPDARSAFEGARPDFWLQQSFAERDAKGQVVTGFTRDELSADEVKDIEGDERGDGLNRTDASLLGESGSSTDMTTAP